MKKDDRLIPETWCMCPDCLAKLPDMEAWEAHKATCPAHHSVRVYEIGFTLHKPYDSIQRKLRVDVIGMTVQDTVPVDHLDTDRVDFIVVYPNNIRMQILARNNDDSTVQEAVDTMKKAYTDRVDRMIAGLKKADLYKDFKELNDEY